MVGVGDGDMRWRALVLFIPMATALAPAAPVSAQTQAPALMCISAEKAKEINRTIKEKGPKGVTSQTQGTTVRVTGKKRDDLQAIIALLKGSDLGIPLQMENFRD